MIVVEQYITRKDGVELFRTYSDRGMMIERDGVLYEEAIDPVDRGRVYNETETPIPVPEEPETEKEDKAPEKGAEENTEVVI